MFSTFYFTPAGNYCISATSKIYMRGLQYRFTITSFVSFNFHFIMSAGFDTEGCFSCKLL